MKRTIAVGMIVCLVSIGAVWSTLAAKTAADGIKWYGYDEGLALAQQEGKKLFLSFHADWCTYCEKMERETFTNAAVIEYLNRHYIASRVDSDENRKLAKEYYVRTLPLTWFVSEKGEKISSMPGFIEAEHLMQILRFIHSDSYRKMSFKAFMDQNGG